VTKEKDILREKYERLLEKLEATDPIEYPREFVGILDMLDRLHCTIDRHPEPLGYSPIEKLPDRLPASEPSVEEYTPPVMEVVPAEEPAPASYTKEEVRAALAKSRKNGVNVTELLAEFGAENFTGLPAAKYGELMSRLGEN